MLFQVYGENAMYQWLGWIMVFVSLIAANEVARRSKTGGIVCFLGIPAVLTVYFIAIYVCAGMGMEWALDNPTYLHMGSWFHYAKLYAATAGCIGFMMLKYGWGKLGRSEAFKVFPFAIVAINILIAVASDFESAMRAFGTTWVSTEGVVLMGGWHNVFNGIAGLINIFCMTGWWGIYRSKKGDDMLWPDMTWVYILAYDLWNFCYTYNCLPHACVVLRPCPAARAHRRQLLLEQGRLDSEPREHPCSVVHVRPGVPHVPGLQRLLRQLREQPERQSRRLPYRSHRERRRIRLHHAPCQEARREPL